MELQMWYPEKDITSTVHLLVEKEFNHMETSANHKMRNFLFLKKGGGTVSFENINVLKNTDKLWNYSKQKEAEEIWQLNTFLTLDWILYWREKCYKEH